MICDNPECKKEFTSNPHYRKHTPQKYCSEECRKKMCREMWNKKHPERGRKYVKKVKDEIFSLLGNKCARCGFDDPRALQIDHINGNGTQERQNFSQYKYYKHVLERILLGSKDYQLLCANCNWIKREENKEYN